MVLMSDERTSGLWVPGSPADRARAPTALEIVDLKKESKQYFGDFHNQCELEEEYYLGKRKVAAPDGIEPVWPATASAIINVATDHVDVNNLAIDVPSSPRSKARSERVQKGLIGLWASIKPPVLRTCIRHSFLYGTAFIKSMFDPLNWPDAPVHDDFSGDDEYREALKEFMEDRRIKFPLVVESVSPKNMMWDDSRGKIKWVIETTERSARSIADAYPEWLSSADSDGAVEWTEYWDDEWVVYMADDDIVWGPEKHSYGHVPYTQLLPVMSYTFDDACVEDRYRGLLRPIHDLLDEEARIIAQTDSIVRTIGWRTLDFRGPEAAAIRARDDYKMFGGMNVIPAGVEVGLSPLAQVPPDLWRQLDVIQDKIEQATFPNVVRGVRPKGVSTGFGISVLAGMGRLVFQGIADGARHMVEETNSKFLELIENLVRGNITVHARSDVHQFDQAIGPDDIRGLRENIVQIKAEAPEERERESLLAMRLMQAGIISLYEAQRRSGIASPLDEQNQIAAERLLQSPELMSIQAQQVLQRVGLQPQLEAAASPTGQTPGPAGVNVGSQNVGGAQLQRPGERNMQQARVASQQGQPSVFPQGMGGIDNLASILGTPTGGAQGMPSGQTIRRG